MDTEQYLRDYQAGVDAAFDRYKTSMNAAIDQYAHGMKQSADKAINTAMWAMLAIVGVSSIVLALIWGHIR